MKYLGPQNTINLSRDIKFSNNAISITKIDRDSFFEDIITKNKRLGETVERYKEDLPEIEELACDIFYSLYKYAPRLVDFNQMSSDFLLNHSAVKTLIESTKYKEVRAITERDRLTSTVGTEVLLPVAVEAITELKEKAEALKEQLDEAREALEGSESEDAEDGLSGSSQRLTFEEAQEYLEKVRDEYEKLFDNTQKRKLEKGLSLLEEDLAGIQDSITQWGLGHDGTYQKMSYEEKVKLIEDLKHNEKLQKIALLAGKLKDLAFKGKEVKSKKARSSIDGVEQGNALNRTLQPELTGLGIKETRPLFFKKYKDRKLLQHNYSGRKKLGLGPVVALIDSSGSMNGHSEIYAKAVCLTLLEIAKKQKRSFLVAHFDSGESAEKLKTHRFIKDKPYSINDIIDLAEYFAGGGTDFEPPLKRAQIEIDQQPQFSKADIVMITDGNAPIGEEFLKDFNSWRKKRKVSLFSILIDGWGGTKESLNHFSDSVSTLENIETDGVVSAKKLFTHIL